MLWPSAPLSFTLCGDLWCCDHLPHGVERGETDRRREPQSVWCVVCPVVCPPSSHSQHGDWRYNQSRPLWDYNQRGGFSLLDTHELYWIILLLVKIQFDPSPVICYWGTFSDDTKLLKRKLCEPTVSINVNWRYKLDIFYHSSIIFIVLGFYFNFQCSDISGEWWGELSLSVQGLPWMTRGRQIQIWRI